MSAPVVLATAGLSKHFGRLRAVDGLDLAVPAGCVYGFLGPNGSGKTTTIRMALGLIRPTAGRVEVMGRNLAHRARALAEVGAQVESPAFYNYLSGRRNLELLAALTGPVARGAIDAALARVRLDGRERDKVRTYSQGMKTRLALAQALLPRPRLLVLDEPTNGLDPQGMKEVRELIRDLARDDGITIFLSSHLLAEVQQVCDRVAVIHKGRLVAQGPVAELLRGDGEVCVRCDEPERAAVAARAVAGEATVTADGLRVALAEEAVPELVAALVAAGVRVREVVRERRTLEEFFLGVTGQQEAAL